nr:hypothetical protein [Haloarchaeobius salinus]
MKNAVSVKQTVLTFLVLDRDPLFLKEFVPHPFAVVAAKARLFESTKRCIGLAVVGNLTGFLPHFGEW